MKEYTGSLNLTIEVTVKAKNRKEASSMFDDLYTQISIENDGNQLIEIVSDNLGLLENSWDIED
ncbi:MAG: hypothetical protein PX635_02780 [Nostocales cyanobacterium LE14-WE12]|jgi:hypothetical protein|nr:hypothetical protein [Nostocales cyanobacterium LE14-WE12]